MSKRGWILGLLIALPVVVAQRFSGSPFYGYGFGGGGGLYGLDLYGLYPGIIDFLVFFMIFAGLARLVFSKWFGDKEGVKPLYLGLALALSLGGTYYGYLSLQNFGNFAFPFFIIIGIAAMFGVLRLFGMNKWLAIITAIIVVLYSAPIFSGIGSAAYGKNILNYIPNLFYGRWTLLGIVLLILAGWLFYHISKGYKYGGGGGGSRGASDQGLPTAPSGGPGFFKRLFRRKPKPKGGATRGRGRKTAKQFKKSYISFQEGQFNLLINLSNAIGDWANVYYNKNATAKDYYKARKRVLQVLKQIRANTRYQRRRLRWARKAADKLNNQSINSIIKKIEIDESDFMLYVSKMINRTSTIPKDFKEIRAKVGLPPEIASYYNSLRSLAIELRDLYNSLDREMHK